MLHVTWFYKNNPRKKRSPSMQFWHAICLLAAHKKIKPYKILCKKSVGKQKLNFWSFHETGKGF